MENVYTSLKYLVEITKGKKPKYEIDEYSEGLIPYLSMDYLRGKNFSRIYVDETIDNIVRVNNNDLLILWDGSKAGEIVHGKDGALSSTMAKIEIVSSKVTKAYLTYFLIHCQADIQGNTVGMGIPHVNGEDLKNLSIYLPSQQTQIRIAEFLDNKTAEIDTIIEKKEALLIRLEEKKKAIINEAVTGKKVWNGNAWTEPTEVKDSGIEWIGEIPVHWDLIRLKFAAKITTGNKDTVNREDDGKYHFFVRSPKIERINTYSFDGEAILMAGDGVGAGKVFHYFNGKFDYHQRVYNIYDFSGISGKFLFYFMSQLFFNVMEQLSAKNTVDSVRLPMIENFLIPIFDIEEQNLIVNFLEEKIAKIDQLVIRSRIQIEKLKEYRQAIISETVTGKLEIE